MAFQQMPGSIYFDPETFRYVVVVRGDGGMLTAPAAVMALIAEMVSRKAAALEPPGFGEEPASGRACIGCGCKDDDPCEGADGPCWWMSAEDFAGVCSMCEDELSRFGDGARTIKIAEESP
jgi:hypothetical protein